MLKPDTGEIMSKCLFILAMAGILSQSFGRLYILVHFKLNQKKIAQTLCIRKDEPGNCCKGKCYLNKQLEEQQDREDSGKSPELKNKEEVQFFQGSCRFRFYSFAVTEPWASYLPAIPEGKDQGIFRPPKLVATS